MPKVTKSARAQQAIARACVEGAKLFAEKGYSETTTRELSAAMDLTNGTFYYYFPGKEDLLMQISLDAIQETIAAVTAALETAEPGPGAMSALIHAHVKTLIHSQNAHTTMLTELRALKGERRDVVLAERGRYEKLVRKVIDVGQKEGWLTKQISAGMLALMLHNLLNWTIFWYRPGTGLSVDEIADNMVTLYMGGAAPRE
jgi:AcrR family transcriptional regulator